MPMKIYLIAPLAAFMPAFMSQNVFPAPDEVMSSGGIGFSAERAVDFVRGGVNVFDYFNAAQRNDVRACRLKQDVTSGIQVAVKAAASSGSGRVVLPGGCYRTTNTIMLPSDIELVGASMRATKIMPVGNFPAILATGSYARGLTGVGVQNMSIVCAGMSNMNAMGVKLVYVNRGKLKDLYFNGCRHGLDLYDQWQTSIENVTVDGLGAQQNHIGVYMGAPTDPANKTPNNAVILSNSTMQNVALYGYQLVFFAGSKFINSEAMNGVTGWKLCGSPYIIAEQACQFGQFSNIVADTTSGPGIVVDQGANANPINNVMFDHVWIGSSNVHAIYVAGVTYSQFDDIHVTRSDNGAYLHNSNNVKISVNVAQYNQNNNGSYAVVINGGSNNALWAANSQSKYPLGYNGIAEVGPTYGNSIWGGLASCTLELRFDSGARAQETDYADRSCHYEVQGRQVRMMFSLKPSKLGSTHGPAMLRGLPFAADRGALQEGAVGGILADAVNGIDGTVIAQVIPGNSAAQLFAQSATGSIPLTHRNFSNSSSLSGTIEYIKK